MTAGEIHPYELSYFFLGKVGVCLFFYIETKKMILSGWILYTDCNFYTGERLQNNLLFVCVNILHEYFNFLCQSSNNLQ